MKHSRDRYLTYLDAAVEQQQGHCKQHIDQHRRVFANNRNSAGFSSVMKELTFTQCIKSGDGAYITDLNGNRLLDLTMGFGVHLFGHKVPFLDDAIRQQLDNGCVLGPLYESAGDVAQLLHEMTGVERSAFYNSGTEAVMVAMRIAKAATGKNKIVIFKGCYHGTHDTILAMKSDKHSHAALTTTPGISNTILADTILLDFGSEESLRFLQDNHDTIAAVLTEPVQSRHPEWCNKAYLQQLRDVTKKHNIALIFDEVITGFRVGNGGAAEFFSITPDIRTFGKVLGGGMPIGVVAGDKTYMDFIDGGGDWNFGNDSGLSSAMTFVAGTFCHHPLAMATAKATLLHLKEHQGQIQKQLNQTTANFCQRMNEFFKAFGFPLELTSFSSLFRFILKGRGRYLYYALLKEGVYIWEGRNCFLSTAHSEEDVQMLMMKIKKVCFELYASGMLMSERPLIQVNAVQAYTQIALQLDKTIDVNLLEISSRYVAINVPSLSHYAVDVLHTSVESQSELDNCLIEAQLNGNSAIQLTTITFNEKTVCLLSISRTLCDGWSLTLFCRELERCYRALSQQEILPEIALLDQCIFDQWLTPGLLIDDENRRLDENPYELIESQSYCTQIQRSQLIDSCSDYSEFEGLLCQFISALEDVVSEKFSEQEITVAVPIAGQIMARKLKVFGSCSALLPITRQRTLNFSDQLASVSQQMKAAKKHFKYCYREQQKQAPAAIVFNVDNLMVLPFSAEQASVYLLNESVTKHALVCNVSACTETLFIAMKYDETRFSIMQIEALTQSFIQRLVEPERSVA